MSRSASLYSIAAVVSRAISSEGMNLFPQRERLAVKPPCFKAFLLPLGAPPAAPYIRHTYAPEPLALGTVGRSASIWRGISMPGA